MTGKKWVPTEGDLLGHLAVRQLEAILAITEEKDKDKLLLTVYGNVQVHLQSRGVIK